MSSVFAAPLASPALLHFMKNPDPLAGLEGLCFRLSILVSAAMAMRTYMDIVRGPDRPVLDPHPILSGLLLNAIALRTASKTFWWPLALWMLAWPLLVNGHSPLFFWLGAPLISAWVGMLGLGYAVHLGSVHFSTSPSAAPLLDMLRGENPREQAAFIYAPGFALFAIGLGLMLSSAALSGAIAGSPVAILLLFVPMCAGIFGFLLAHPLARRQYISASAVLAEIDSRWALLDKTEEQSRVYFDWLSTDRPELLRALRQGWRRLRVWPMGAWGVGFVALISSMSGDVRTAGLIVAAGVVISCAVPTRLCQGDPPWLDNALGVDTVKVGIARATVAFLYAQGAILPSALLILLRGGGVETFFFMELLALLCSALAAFIAFNWPKRSTGMWAPLALLLWSAMWRIL